MPFGYDEIAKKRGRGYDAAGWAAKYGPTPALMPEGKKGQHLTDEFKLPDHITFSKESIYSSPEQEGGDWVKGSDGKWHFYASPYNLTQHSASELQAYFMEYEPDSVLHLPGEE